MREELRTVESDFFFLICVLLFLSKERRRKLMFFFHEYRMILKTSHFQMMKQNLIYLMKYLSLMQSLIHRHLNPLLWQMKA